MPVANVLSAPQIVVVRGDLPVNTLQELVAYAKAHPMKLNYASSGNGSLQHVTGVTGWSRPPASRWCDVPYKGTGPALQLGCWVARRSLTFGTAPPFMPHIASGKLRVLAVDGQATPAQPVPGRADDEPRRATPRRMPPRGLRCLRRPAAPKAGGGGSVPRTCAPWCRAPAFQQRALRMPSRPCRGCDRYFRWQEVCSTWAKHAT